LKGDPTCPDLVASSVYDTKLVHFLSMVCKALTWIVKDRKVYNVDKGRVESTRFLRMNTIDTYNNTMGSIDISDQLRNTYRFDHWLRNRKWWWSIFWAFGVMLVNAYVLYVSLNLKAGKKKKDLLSHHDFRTAISID